MIFDKPLEKERAMSEVDSDATSKKAEVEMVISEEAKVVKEVDKYKVVESTVTVMRTVPKVIKDAGIEVKEEELRTIDIHKFITEPAKVEVTYGRKKMIERFEPVEIRVSVQMPCYKEEISDAYAFVEGLVTDIMKKEMENLVAFIEEKKGEKDKEAGEKDKEAKVLLEEAATGKTVDSEGAKDESKREGSGKKEKWY